MVLPFRSLRPVSAGVVVLALTAAAHGAFAQTPDDLLAGTRVLVPVPVNAATDPALTVSVDRRVLRIGETVEICFSAGQPGYVTLWNIGSNGQVARVFPNAYSGGDPAAMKVPGGGQRQCAGSAGDPFRFRVGGPPGREDLYLTWTATPDLQPAAAGFAGAEDLAQAFARMAQQNPATWAAVKTTYEIEGSAGPAAAPEEPPPPPPAVPPPPPPAPAAPPAAPPPPPPAAAVPPPPAPPPQAPTPTPPQAAAPSAASRNVYILAMGSNVDPLTKSNQDAQMFVGEFRRLMSVPPQNIRVYKNVYRRQFIEGMDWLKTMVHPGDVAVIYYSGHGSTVSDDDGDETDGLDEVFVTYDVEGKSKPSSRDIVRDDEYAAMVEALNTDQVLSVIDACHSGGLNRGVGTAMTGTNAKFFVAGELGTTPPSPTRALSKPRNQPKGTLLAAAREDQSALEGENGSLFTLALTSSMKTTQTGSVMDIFTSAAQAVRKATKNEQTPVVAGEHTTAQRIRVQR